MRNSPRIIDYYKTVLQLLTVLPPGAPAIAARLDYISVRFVKYLRYPRQNNNRNLATSTSQSSPDFFDDFCKSICSGPPISQDSVVVRSLHRYCRAPRSRPPSPAAGAGRSCRIAKPLVPHNPPLSISQKPLSTPKPQPKWLATTNTLRSTPRRTTSSLRTASSEHALRIKLRYASWPAALSAQSHSSSTFFLHNLIHTHLSF